MIGRVAAPAAAKAVASAPVQAIWGAQRGVVYNTGVGMGGLNTAVMQEATKYGVRNEVVQWAKAHPTIVPYINADKDMIHSIAETGWTRWLVGDGSSYINTNYYANQDTRFYSVLRSQSAGNSAGMLFGCRISRGNNQFILYDWLSSFDTGYGNQNITFGTNRANDIFIFDFNKNNWNIENKTTNAKYTAKYSYAAFTNTLPFILFGAHWSASSIGKSKGYLSCAKLYRNGELDRHFLPCRNLNGTDYGMVDIVSGQFYGNANTQGSFSVELTENT